MMNKILLIVFITGLLYARENPFKPTKTFLDLQIKQNKISKEKTTTSIATKKIEQKVQKQIKKSKQVNKNNILVYKPLKFLTLTLDNKHLVIQISKKYKLKSSMLNENKTKFIYDFIGRVTFYTIRKALKNNNFIESFVIGTHLKERYFRVVIKIKKDIKHYKEIKKSNKIILQFN